jgi:hypothetical protein
VDNSKILPWAARFAQEDGLDCRFAHVLRDPRGYIASTRRRGNPALDEALNDWQKENAAISSFIIETGRPTVSVCYDLLAQGDSDEWHRIFRALGLAWSADALRYWEREHHGFAANGASDPVVRGGRPNSDNAISGNPA